VDSGRSLAGSGAGGFVPLPAVLVTVVATGFLGGLAGSRLTSGDDAAVPAPTETIEAVQVERDRLRRTGNGLAAERDRLTGLRAERRARREELASGLAAAGTASSGHRVPVVPPEYGDLLALVDWNVLGENVAEFSRLLGRLAECLRTGVEFDPDWTKERDRRNGVILREAVRTWDGLPAHDLSLPHTHPVFAANAIAAALEYLGRPLTTRQRHLVVEELRLFLAADRARLAADREGVLSLTKLREESELKEKHLAAIRATLTDGQRAALWPDGIVNRVGLDLYSPGILWASSQRLKHVDCTDREDFVAELSAGLKAALSVREEEREALVRIVGDWAAELPPESFVESTDALVRAGIPMLEDLHAAARRTETLLRRLAEGLPENAARTRVILYSTGVILPRVTAEGNEVK
ncbi:MAG: hypothetical protein ABFS86_13160, partial [Planctomycetota bacterium]